MGGIAYKREVLETERITLRPFGFDDAGRVRLLLGDYEVSKTLARVPYPYTAEQVDQWLTRIVDPEMVSQADFAMDIGQGVIGGIGLREVDGRAQLGFWLTSSHWGQGLMSEGACAALVWLFETTDHDGIDSGAFVGNATSLRVQEKLGFEVTGQQMAHCLAQRKDLPHIDTQLTRSRFEMLNA